MIALSSSAMREIHVTSCEDNRSRLAYHSRGYENKDEVMVSVVKETKSDVYYERETQGLISHIISWSLGSIKKCLDYGFK